MERKKLMVMTLAAAITAVCSMNADARGFGPGTHGHGSWGGFRGMRVFLELKLSDAQQVKMLEIMDKYREKSDRLRDQMRKARSQIREVMSSEKFNEASLRDALRKSSSIREEFIVIRAKMKAEMRTILTPDQLKILGERKARFHNCRGGRWGETGSKRAVVLPKGG